MLEVLARYLPRSVEHRIRRRIHAREPLSDRMNLLIRMRSAVFPPGYTLTTSDRLQSLFIHIPKCAGVSITNSLYGNLGPGHIRAEEYQLLYSPEELKRLFKFTFVRNPWDRLASAYFFLKSGGMNDRDKEFAIRHLSQFADFEHFVMDWVNDQNIYLYEHFQPQNYYLTVNRRRFHLDFVGRFERLSEDFRAVCKYLGRTVELSWLNRTPTPNRDYRSLYNDSMVRKVAAVYADDIRTFAYKFT